MLLGKEVSKASIAKILDVSRSALYHFIKTLINDKWNSRSDNWKSPHKGLIKKSCSRSLRRLFPGPPFCKKERCS